MKITELDIDRFRIWRSLLLKLNPTGLNVIYGPNEAGKTTLMNFVRSALYGFTPLNDEPAWHRSEDDLPWKGALRCEHGGRTWRLSRTAAKKNRGNLKISGRPQEMDVDDAMQFLLAETEEHVFTDVFAVGVRELQELATLGSNQVSEYIYGLSLGPQGRALLDALGNVRDRQNALFSQHGKEGQLPDLFERYADLTVSNQKKGEAREQHTRLVQRRTVLNTSIEELQIREGQISNELTGLRFLTNCHKPWSRIQSLQKQLTELPLILHDPQHALDQLDAAEKDIQKHSSRREKLSDQSAALRKQADRLELDLAFEKDRYAIQSLVDQSDWLRTLDQNISSAEVRSAELKRGLEHQLSEMGSAWTIERLNDIDTSSTTHNALLDSARKYQDALQRRGKLRRWNRSMTKKSQNELMELETDLQVLGIESIDDAIAREQTRLRELENLGKLRLQREQMALKIKTVRNVMSRVDTDDSIPPWVDRAVSMIAAVGVVLFFSGIILYAWAPQGSQPNRILGGSLAAAAFSFAGMMWWGIRNGLANYFDRKTGIQLDDLNAQAREAEKNLRAVHERIQRIQSDGIAGQHLMKADAPGTTTADLVNCIGECSRHITDLENLARRQERARSRRQRLQSLRTKYRESQNVVNDRRQAWCKLLASLGMDETVKVQEAFDWWQTIQEVREMHTQWRNAAPETEGLKRMFNGMRDRVEQLGHQVSPQGLLNYSRPLEVLTGWSQQLKTHDRDRLERNRLVKEADELHRDSLSEQHKVEAAEMRRGAVLARAGVLSRDELSEQVEVVRERQQIDQRLAAAKDELIDVTSAEPELAIVEDDLVRFDPRSAREKIMLLEGEQKDVELQLAEFHEELGALKQEIKLLETSRESQVRYFHKAQAAADIYRAAEEWFSLQIEENAVMDMRKKFEKENISGTLTTASSYLHRISSGRYHKIWAPLGEDFLCVDDEYGRTFRVEQLSGGTREQLFLALRFALVREFAKRGIELPVVMDDVFVNFDEERTDAATDCLIEIASEGQQVLFFTCHQHLAELFQKKQVEPLFLPGHKVAYDLNKPEDEAAAFAEVGGESDRTATATYGTAEVNGQIAGQAFHANADDLFDQEDEPAADQKATTKEVGQDLDTKQPLKDTGS